MHHISAIFAKPFAFSHAKKKPNLGESWADKKQTIMENQIALLDEPSLGFDG